MSNLRKQAETSGPASGFASTASRLGRALGDLHQRRVFRTAVAYTLAMWLVLQIADVVFPLLDVPAAALKVVAGAAVLGFPVAVVVAWLYQITPNGIVIDRRSRLALVGTRSDWILNSSLLAISSAFALLLLLGLLSGGTRETPRIAIKVTEIAQRIGGAASIAPGLEHELRHEVAQTTNLEPMSPEHPSEVRDIVNLVLWVSVHVEDGQLRVRSLLQNLEGEGSYPYVGAFELPMRGKADVEREAAVRIVAELRSALRRAAGASSPSGRRVIFRSASADRGTAGTLPGCEAPGLGSTGRP